VRANEQAALQLLDESSRQPGKILKHKVTMLVAGTPPALFQVIEYLFCGWPELEIVESPRGAKGVRWQGGRPLPELIVVNVDPLRTRVCHTLRSLKRSSPRSKLILICPVRGFADSARRCGADACLEEEALVGRLLRTAQRLARASQTEMLRSEKKSA
jgi:hypothetical protein